MYNLESTTDMMLSDNDTENLKAEYIQTFIRFKKLQKADFNELSDLELKAIIMQKIDMYKYLSELKIRLKERGIIIEDEEIEI